MNISDRLKALLDAQSLTIKAFSELTEIPYRSVQNYLREERDPNAEALNKICEKMNVNLNWLITGNGEMFINKIDHSTLTSKELELIEKVRSTTDVGQKSIHQTAIMVSEELK